MWKLVLIIILFTGLTYCGCKAEYDFNSGNSYFICTNEYTKKVEITGFNLTTDAYWTTIYDIRKNALEGYDKNYNYWNYEDYDQSYYNYGTWEICYGEGEFRICY